MTDAGPALSSCPPAEELAAFCWNRGSEAMRAVIVQHLAECLACRTQAARMMAHAHSDRRSSSSGESR